jgi:hypothetical protein
VAEIVGTLTELRPGPIGPHDIAFSLRLAARGLVTRPKRWYG